MTADAAPTLVIIRGNSGSGKTTTAREVRKRYGRGAALIEQDQLRRVVLCEHDSSKIDPVAPTFITTMARTALHLGYHVVLEGILNADRYAVVLRELISEHPGRSAVFYLDVTFAETVRRHESRSETVGFTPEQMREWYTPQDLLGVPGEQVIGESSSFEDTVATILHTSGLAGSAALTPCPNRCPRCAAKREQSMSSLRPTAWPR